MHNTLCKGIHFCLFCVVSSGSELSRTEPEIGCLVSGFVIKLLIIAQEFYYMLLRASWKQLHFSPPPLPPNHRTSFPRPYPSCLDDYGMKLPHMDLYFQMNQADPSNPACVP